MSAELNLEDAIEQSVIAFIAATGTHSVNIGITARQEIEDKSGDDYLTLPSIVIKAERSSELSPGAGVYQFRVTATLTTQADDTTNATQRAQWANLRTILEWDALASALTTSTLHVFNGSIQREDSTDRTEIERAWRQVYAFTLWACAKSS